MISTSSWSMWSISEDSLGFASSTQPFSPNDLKMALGSMADNASATDWPLAPCFLPRVALLGEDAQFQNSRSSGPSAASIVTVFTFSSSINWGIIGTSRSFSESFRTSTFTAFSGWRTLIFSFERAARPMLDTFIANWVASISGKSTNDSSATGKSIRWMLSGAVESTEQTRF